MAWYHVFGIGRRSPLPVSAPLTAQNTEAFTAVEVPKPDKKLLPQSQGWQKELWGYYENSGEFAYAINWLSQMLSRVRLRAAEIQPGRDEPTIVDSGPVADLLEKFGGGIVGQPQLMAAFTVQLSVPGEGYLIGETIRGVESWSVRSIDEIRVKDGQYEIIDEDAVTLTWRPLSAESLVVRFRNPDKRMASLPWSPAKAARGTLRELELVNRAIQAQYLSRLATAGMVALPDEIMFPVREEFEDSVDPFMSEWIENAAQAIKEPGTASAVVPIPIRMPGEWIEKIKFLDFTSKFDEKIIEKRESAIRRVASQVNIPPEVLLGMGNANHWTAWQLDEGALKTNIAPIAEMICQMITKGYIQPRLTASGEKDVSQHVVWYDMSELALRPDRSADAIVAYDRLELSSQALRRELGFDEDDAPTQDELEDMVRKLVAKTPEMAGVILGEIPGLPVTGSEEPEAPPKPAPEPVSGPPEEPSDTELRIRMDELSLARKKRAADQARLRHAIRVEMGGTWTLLHPPACAQGLYSCPHIQAAENLERLPGTRGIYEHRLGPLGQSLIGPRSPTLDISRYLTTPSKARMGV